MREAACRGRPIAFMRVGWRHAHIGIDKRWRKLTAFQLLAVGYVFYQGAAGRLSAD